MGPLATLHRPLLSTCLRRLPSTWHQTESSSGPSLSASRARTICNSFRRLMIYIRFSNHTLSTLSYVRSNTGSTSVCRTSPLDTRDSGDVQMIRRGCVIVIGTHILPLMNHVEGNDQEESQECRKNKNK